MFEYNAIITWKRGESENFTDRKYSREHTWEFDGNLLLDATPSHHIVPVPYSNPNSIDPEQAFVASLSSCHMLFFLDLCSQAGIIVDHYSDEAIGELSRIGRNKMAMTKVTLKPNASYSGKNIPSIEKLEELHHRAHELCYIANSVTSEIITEIIS